jgi:hypothetical protein
MRIFLALIVAPALVLAAQAAMYALVTPECSHQARVAIHAVACVALVLCILFAVMARGAAMPSGISPDEDVADPPATRHFLAVVASAVGALSALVVVGMWIGAWILSPCS